VPARHLAPIFNDKTVWSIIRRRLMVGCLVARIVESSYVVTVIFVYDRNSVIPVVGVFSVRYERVRFTLY
jgi:hypothetical protein